MSDDQTPERLRSLDARLKDAREREAGAIRPKGKAGEPPKSALGLAFRISVEILAALAVGVGIGWVLDRWLGTGPWLLMAFILLGGAAGILNVYRMARGFGYAAGYRKTAPGTDGSGKNERT
jgi:ATP synthase protein I